MGIADMGMGISTIFGGGGGDNSFTSLYLNQMWKDQEAQRQHQYDMERQAASNTAMNNMLTTMTGAINQPLDYSKYANYGGGVQSQTPVNTIAASNPANTAGLANAMTTNQNYGYRDYSQAPRGKWGI